MRKKIAIALVAAMFVSTFSMLGTGAVKVQGAVTTYKFGGDTAIDGQDGTAQGQNGWYYMWSPEHNKNGVYDVTKIKESVYSETGSAHIPYLPDQKGWIADIYAGDDYNGGANWTNWWKQTPDGTMNPAVAQNAAKNEVFASVVLGWKAPKDGEYSFNLKYTAGGQSYWDAGSNTDYPSSGDGVTVSMYAGSKMLYSQATTIKEDAMALQYDPNNPDAAPAAVGDPYKAALLDKDVTAAGTAYLKAGQMLYIIVDPNKDGGEDVAKVEVEATKIGSYVDNKKVFKFGGATVIDGQDGTAQGQNDWYYLWTPEYNVNGVFDLNKVKESVYSETGSAFIPYLPGQKGWIADIYTGDDYDGGANWTNWWRQTSDGILNPAVAQNAAKNEVFATAVLGWKAPADGEYTFNLKYTAGNKSYWDDATSTDYPAKGDGVTVSVYAAGNKLYSQATTIKEDATALQYDPNDWNAAPVVVGDPYKGAYIDKDVTAEFTKVTLKKGEMLYLFVDPNTSGDYDEAKVELEVIQTKALSTGSNTADDSTVQTEPVTSIPKTGETGVTEIILLSLIGVTGAVSIKLSKKRTN